jgi:hypothetical protein
LVLFIFHTAFFASHARCKREIQLRLVKGFSKSCGIAACFSFLFQRSVVQYAVLGIELVRFGYSGNIEKKYLACKLSNVEKNPRATQHVLPKRKWSTKIALVKRTKEHLGGDCTVQGI